MEWLRPKGKLPASVYWRRRILVLTLAVLLIAAIVLGIRQATRGTPSDDQSSLVGADVPAASASTAESSAPVTPSGTPSWVTIPPPPSTSARLPNPVTPLAEPCFPGSLSMRLEGPNTIDGEAGMPMRLWVGSTQSECTTDMSALGLAFEVLSGGDRIWDTWQCPEWLPRETIEVNVREESPVEFVWPARRSAGCELGEDELKAGTYVVSAVMGNSRAEHVVQITEGA